MSFFSPKKSIAVHDGRFHADEIFACAVLSLYHKGNVRIVRTRDQKKIEQAFYVLDVGGKYDHHTRHYDHHQKEGAGFHENGIPYATFGLIWKHYGGYLALSEFVFKSIENKLVCPIDANDTGVTITEKKFDDISQYTLQSIIGTRIPTWLEEDTIDLDREFVSLVDFAKDILYREIQMAAATETATKFIQQEYLQSNDKRIIQLSRKFPYEEILPRYPEPLFVVYKGRNDLWRAESVPAKANSYFERRKNFPQSWGGLRDEALEDITGVEGALFCHKGCFLCVATTKEAALRLARKALLDTRETLSDTSEKEY